MENSLVKFLLVEDDDDHAHLISRSLERARVKNSVARVTDGAQALQYLRNEAPFENVLRPDIVLLDLKLPKINGHEVLSIIKSDESLSSIPVVIMTTSDAETDRAKAYQLHANSYLVKPIDFDKFRELVNDLSLYWGVWNAPPPNED